jgi:hypothetical protein
MLTITERWFSATTGGYRWASLVGEGDECVKYNRFFELALVLIGIVAFLLDLQVVPHLIRLISNPEKTAAEYILKAALPDIYELLQVTYENGTMQIWIQDGRPYRDSGSGDFFESLAQTAIKTPYFLVVVGRALQALPDLADAAFTSPKINALRVTLQTIVEQHDQYGNLKTTPVVVAEFGLTRELFEKANLKNLSQRCTKFLQLLEQEGEAQITLAQAKEAITLTTNPLALLLSAPELYSLYDTAASVDPSQLSPDERALLCWFSL